MQAPDQPRKPRTLQQMFAARINAAISTREALNPELMQRAHEAAARGDHTKADYWARKARKLNTVAGVKQLLRGGTAREVRERAEQKATIDEAKRAEAIEAARAAALEAQNPLPMRTKPDPCMADEVDNFVEAARRES